MYDNYFCLYVVIRRHVMIKTLAGPEIIAINVIITRRFPTNLIKQHNSARIFNREIKI